MLGVPAKILREKTAGGRKMKEMNPVSRAYAVTIAFLFFIAVLSVAILVFPDHPAVRVFWGGTYASLIRGALGVTLVLWIVGRFCGRAIPRRWLQWTGGLLFLPVAFFPLLRCYFKVPYVFCRACPHPCPWGISRVFLFNGFLLLNLAGRSWCDLLCPFGTFQEALSRITRRHWRFSAWFAGTAYAALFAALGFYLATLFRWPWLNFFDVGRYDFLKVTALFAVACVVAAFFVPKFWCRYLCPVGTIDSLVSSFRKKA